MSYKVGDYVVITKSNIAHYHLGEEDVGLVAKIVMTDNYRCLLEFDEPHIWTYDGRTGGYNVDKKRYYGYSSFKPATESSFYLTNDNKTILCEIYKNRVISIRDLEEL